jgi:hypothetical protein
MPPINWIDVIAILTTAGFGAMFISWVWSMFDRLE